MRGEGWYGRGAREGWNVGRSAVTTVSANVAGSKVKVMEVDKDRTLRVTSHMCGKGRAVARIPARAVRCKRMVSKSRAISRMLIVIVHKSHAFAKRSAIRVGYRNKACIMDEILRAILGTKTEPTRPKRFAGETFLGNGVSLSRTRTIVSIVASRGRCTLRDSVDRLGKDIGGEVGRVHRGVVCRATFVRATLSSPRRVDISKCNRILGRTTRRIVKRLGRLVSSSSSKEVVGRKVRAMVLKGPGTKGSSLLGVLTNRSHTVIASVRKAAESILRRRVHLRKLALGVVSATKVHRASSVIRGVNISGTGRCTGRTSLVVCIMSTSEGLSRGSRGVFSLVCSGEAIVLLGGSSLSAMIARRVVHREVSRGNIRGRVPIVTVSTGRRRKVGRLRGAIGTVFLGKSLSFGRRICVAGTERGGTLIGTERDVGGIVFDVSTNVPRSFCSVSLVSTCRSLKGVAKRSVKRSLMGRVFDGFYVKGWE